MRWWNSFSEKKEDKFSILDKVKDGQTIGFGSGTTSYITAIEIGEKVQEIMFRLYRDISSVEFDQAHHRLVLKAEEYEKSK